MTDAGNRAASQTIEYFAGTNKHPFPNVVGVAVDSGDDLYVLTTSTLIIFLDAAATFPDLDAVQEISLSAFSSAPATAITVVNDAATNIYISFASSSSGQIIRIPQPFVASNVVNVVSSYRFAPAGLSMRNDGRLAVSDTLNNGIYVVSTNNGSTPLLVTGGMAPGFGNGPPSVTYFNQPHGIAASADGRMVVCDTGNSLVRVIDTNYNTLTLYGTLSNVWTSHAALAIQHGMPVGGSGGNQFHECVRPRTVGRGHFHQWHSFRDGSLLQSHPGYNRHRITAGGDDQFLRWRYCHQPADDPL